jgi:hypothetical protein
MSIQYQENIRIAAPTPLDRKYYSSRKVSGVQVPYSATTEVNLVLTTSERFEGLTVNVNGTEYWYKDGILDVNLIEKKYDSTIPEGDFVTGGTNLGFFSGKTGIQTLPVTNLSDSSYNGNYYSIYNNYYLGNDGIVHVGASSIDNINRRGYVKNLDSVKSLIWSDYVSGQYLRGWILLTGNISELIGVSVLPYLYRYYNSTTTFPHVNNTWAEGDYYTNGSEMVVSTVIGSTTTGSTITIGGPVYSHTDNNLAHFRTISTQTPELIKVSYDDAFVYLSGTSAVLDGGSKGGGEDIYIGQTGHTLYFKTITGSGNTSVTSSGDTLVVNSLGGIGTLTGATNGLQLFGASGNTVGLGGDLITGTTINGLGLHNFSISNIAEFNVSSSGNTSQLTLKPTGITMSFSGISAGINNDGGLEYGGNYRDDFSEYSLPDVGYLTGITSQKLNASAYCQYTGVTAPNTFLNLNQSVSQTVTCGQPIFNDGIILGSSPSASGISGHTKGRIYYDNCYDSINADIDDEISLLIGQEALRYVYNNTVTTIPDGTPVYETGVQTGIGNKPNVITIGLAIANDWNKSQVIGITTQSIPSNDYGYVTVRGDINNINTLTTSPYSGMTIGDKIYLSPTVAGGLTNIAPISPNTKVELGTLTKKDSVNGKIYTDINPVISLNDISDVTTITPSVDDVIKWNGNEWVNGTVGTVSAGAGVVFFNSTPKLFEPTTTPFGINSYGIGNGVQIASLTKSPVTTPINGCVIIGNAVNDTRFFSAWLYDQPLGRDVIDAGTWKSYTRIAVDSVGGGSLTYAGRNVYQVVQITGDTLSICGSASNARTAYLDNLTGQFIGTYFTGSTVNTDASWLQIYSGDSMGIYQICNKISDNSVCIVTPTIFSNSSGNTSLIWNKLFGSTSDVITCVFPQYCACEASITMPAFDVNCTDRLGQMGYVQSDNTRSVYMTYNGTLTASYFQTPLIQLHNDLAGLQGGTGTERYHISNEKYLVVQSTSGVNTGDETKTTIEAKLTGEIFSHNHPYSGLTGKPDLSIYQTITGFTEYSASTEPVIANAITGVTYVGDGSVIPYTGITNRNIVFNTLKGSGNTVINKVGNDIVICSTGGTGSEYVFDYDIVVSIAEGKTFGKYENGNVIPSSGKTAVDVIKLALSEALEPTLNLSSTGNNVVFGESGKTVKLSFSYMINTLGATVQSAALEWRRNDTGVWTTLTTTTATPTGYTHIIDDSGDRFNSTVINYRYVVVDSAGASGLTTHNVTPQAYVAPLMSILLNGSIISPETQYVREKGNVISSPSGGINSNRSLVDITDWTLERRYDGGSWLVLTSGSTLETQSVTIPSTLDNTIPTNAVSIEYRLTYADEYTNGNGGNQSISFKFYSYWGFNTNVTVSESEIESLANKGFMSSDNLTWNDVNTPVGNYTYYAYPSTYPDFSSIIKNGILQDFDAWQKIADVSVTNSYGESLDYKVWRTNATGVYNATDDIVFT